MSTRLLDPTHDAAMTMNIDPAAVETLITVRDWLRYGASQFTKAGLVFGHGTATPLDEAAFLILESLRLPIDQLEPWLDARLLPVERAGLAALISDRIETRKPAPYLVNAAYIQGHRFYVDERVIVPRSYIGELLGQRLSAVIDDPDDITDVLDLCTGSGCLAILSALAFPGARVDAVELSADALAVARRNVDAYKLEDRVRLIRSDLFSGVAAEQRYDLIIANPPYVATAEMAAFDPEYRAEPVMAHAGGRDGLDLVRRIVVAAQAHMKPAATLIIELGTGRDAFETAFPALECLWLETQTSSGEVVAITAEALSALHAEGAVT
jgi:ribosomal protein L3 glutamine methyltransferase